MDAEDLDGRSAGALGGHCLDAVRRSLEASYRGTGPDHLLANHLKT